MAVQQEQVLVVRERWEKHKKMNPMIQQDLIKLDIQTDLGMNEMIGLMRLHVQEVTRFTTLIALKFLCWFICLLLATILLKLGSPCFGDTGERKKNLSRTIDPVLIAGKELPQINSKKIEGLRMFSFQADNYIPIPFQVDQKDSHGNWVWDVALKDGKTFDDEDPEGEKLIDNNDLLVFLAKDAGDRSSSVSFLSNASIIMEIETRDPLSNATGWVYLAFYDSDPPPLSSRRYMRYLHDEQKILSPTYEIVYSKEHIALIKDMKLNGRPVMDRLKIRGKAEIKLGFFKFSIAFNEEKIDGFIEGYINGPVRTLQGSSIIMRLPLGFRLSGIRCDHIYYPEYLELPLIMSVRFLVNRASLLLTMDYRGHPFQEAYFEGMEHSPIILSKKSASKNLADLQGNWIALSGKAGSILSTMKLPGEVKKHSEMNLYMLDDSTNQNKPEDYPGSEPEAGFKIQTKPDLPKGDYILYMMLFMSPNPFQQGDEKKAENVMNHKVNIKIINRHLKN